MGKRKIVKDDRWKKNERDGTKTSSRRVASRRIASYRVVSHEYRYRFKSERPRTSRQLILEEIEQSD